LFGYVKAKRQQNRERAEEEAQAQVKSAPVKNGTNGKRNGAKAKGKGN